MTDRHLARLREILAPEDLLAARAARRLYDSDSQRVFRHSPDLVLFPRSAEQTAAIARLAAEEGVPLTARGAGTGLSGGAVPLAGGWLVSFTRMREILSIDESTLSAWVQPGLVNRELQEALAPLGLHFAPDPSSQTVSTLGGNVAENAGGPHCLGVGVTTQHVLGMELVDEAGELHRIGCDSPGGDPVDVLGLITGSEGTLALVTALQVRLTPLPAAVATLLAPFTSLPRACACAGEILGRGILPAAIEILDHEVVRAVEGSVFRAGYPEEAEAVLLAEVDGLPQTVAEQRDQLKALLSERGALWVREAEDPAERRALWRGRKGGFGALGRLYRDIYVQDVCVPISRLPEAIGRVGEIAREHGLPVANVFHAGDGNLHPNIGFDRGDPEQLGRLHAACRELMALAVELGGTLSGEHGIGIEKAAYLPLALSPDDRLPLLRLKAALDPAGLLNPGKIFPAEDLDLPPVRGLRVVTAAAGGSDEIEVPRFYRPESEEELSVLLAEREGRGRLLYPSGARLLDELPTLPGPVHRVLSTASLRGIREFAREDFHVEADAGTPWTELQAALATEGQELDWEPSHPEQRSIGGVVACDESWPWRAGLRSPRDRLLGLSGLLAGGEAFTAGGRVVKNVTGYDLCRLMAGSRGALAVLTRLRLRTRPLPEARRLLLLSYPQRERALAATERLHRRCAFPAGLLLLPPRLELAGLAPEFRVALRLEGSASAVRHEEEHCLDLLTREDLAPGESAREDAAGGPWLTCLRDFPAAPEPGRRGVLREFRAAPSRLAEVLPYLGGPWILDLAGRRLRVAEQDKGWIAPAPLVAGGVQERHAELGLRGVEGPSVFTGLAGKTFRERIARALDPDGRLAPGRWLFG